ncbi:flagellar basal body-associated protein FliL [Bacillus methanolicus]|uniref:Flagellar protein FliL n=1 Tax=Bacillus methanolicus (strain MGA3 / ATCC 53907) TaxID=796606 RepID=I3DZB9_BACMM|nr:flagellar basal body-associated protein FliL [Bacillus methanolicus]AIE59660.1 flagellar basal body-associated protein FliL [Bacillus methanolicus MGA3]EIJ79590.1 flagellar basal body-associated protein FliL [Bacillus methanolicus MGA3]UQD51713.1 flagellar basal body-associated protein FliL [Bacillus methanolicus]
MKNNKLLKIMFILLVAITLAGAAAVVAVLKFTGDKEHKEPTIDEVLAVSVDVKDIVTNLASDDFIRISFKMQTDSKDAKEELEKRDFQVRNIIIQELSEKKAEDLRGKEGKQKLEEDLKEKINSLMQEGKVVRVYITESLLQ